MTRSRWSSPLWWWALVPVVAVLAAATVLRAPVAVVAPLIPDITLDLRLDAPSAGLLTSIPILCFGLLTPVASRLLRGVGINLGMILSLGGVVLGSSLRSFTGGAGLWVGTVMIGASLAIGNLVVPMLIGRQFRHRAALLMSMYLAAMNIATTFVTATAVPIAAVVGWRWSAAWWGVIMGAVALVIWAYVYPARANGARVSLRARAGLRAPTSGVADAEPEAPPRRVSRWRLVWLLQIAFAGHTIGYFSMTAWLPVALADLQGLSGAGAGAASSVFQGAGIVGPFLVPLLVGPMRWSQTRTLAVISAAWLVLPIGLLLAPQAWLVWCVIGGLGQGAFITALFLAVIMRSRDVDENRRVSSRVQVSGYVAAAIGPVVLGWLYENQGGWTVPFVFLLCSLLVMTAASIAASRDRSEPPSRQPVPQG